MTEFIQYFIHQKHNYLHFVKTSPTLYVSKVLLRHDRTPNMTVTITVRATITETTITNNKNSKQCTEIAHPLPPPIG